jgi:hypothetical protein
VLRRARPLVASVAAVAVAMLGIAACGGGGDDDSSTSSSSTGPGVSFTNAPVLTEPAVTTPTVPVVTAPTSIVYVTEGASVLVTNASRINGAAGRLSDRLKAVGYTLGEIDVTQILFDPANPNASAVANSLYAAFGGGAITVVELAGAPPVDTGTLGGAGVLVAMGNDIADKTLDELQGITAPPDTSGSSSDTGSGTASGTATTGG